MCLKMFWSKAFSPQWVGGGGRRGKVVRGIGGRGDNQWDRRPRYEEAPDSKVLIPPALTVLLTQSKGFNPVIRHQRHVSLKGRLQ